MPWYAKYDGVDGSVDARDGTSNTIMFAERYRIEGGETSSGNRLFVGNLTMDTFEFVPEIADEVLVGFEHSAQEHSAQDTDHPDFLWAPTLL
jgi:hypothetical protein